MTSLLDIGPLTASVTVRGKALDVKGIDAETLLVLLNNFPKLYKAIGIRKNLDVKDFMELGPDIVTAIIAAASGVGTTADASDKVKALSLTIGEMSEILSPVVAMTFPRGFGPFVDQLTAMVEGASAQSLKVPASK